MIAQARVVLILLVSGTDAASAHDVIGGVGGFYGGLLHPVLVPAHILSLVALGLLIGQQAPPGRKALLAVFAALLIAGIAVVVAAFAAEDMDLAILGVAAIAGVAVALARPLPVTVAALLLVIAGVALELDSVPQEISMLRTLLALGGTAIAALLIPAVLAALMTYLRRDWQRIGVRIVGSWIAASAILVLALRFAR